MENMQNMYMQYMCQWKTEVYFKIIICFLTNLIFLLLGVEMSFRYHLKGLKKRRLKIYKNFQLKGAKELKIYVKKIL